MNEDNRAYNWKAALTKAHEKGFSAEIEVPKTAEPHLPHRLELRNSPPPFSLPKGAQAVYREDTSGTHFQIREYEDYWTVDFDQFNPHYSPARHAAVDATKYTAAAVCVAALAIGGGSGE